MLTIAIPTVREHLIDRCVSSLGDTKYNVQILAQKYHPRFNHEYRDEYLTTQIAFDELIKMIDTEYVFLADDDFIFRPGYEEDLLFAAHAMEQNKDLGCIVFVDSNNEKSMTRSMDIKLAKYNIHIFNPVEIPKLRKESGLFMRTEIIREQFVHRAFGEDISKIIHTFLDGYDVGMQTVNITHAYDLHGELGWKNLSETLFNEKDVKKNPKHFYLNHLKEYNIIDSNGVLTQSAKDIHKYNKKRRTCKRLYKGE